MTIDPVGPRVSTSRECVRDGAMCHQPAYGWHAMTDTKTGAPIPRSKRRGTADIFRYVEQSFYVLIAIALAIAGAMLFGFNAFRFVTEYAIDPAARVLQFLDGLLLVFIIAELIHTVRAVIEENVLRTEPFLIVGIVAAIRRLIVISAQAERELGTDVFEHLMLEMGVLIVAVLVLGATIFMVRHTRRSEPRPEHEED